MQARLRLSNSRAWDELVRVNNGEQAMAPESFGALFDYRYLLADAALTRASLEEALRSENVS